MAPQSVARGALQSGDRAAAGMPNRANVYMGAPTARYGVAILWKTLLCPARSRPILPQPLRDGALLQRDLFGASLSVPDRSRRVMLAIVETRTRR